LNEGRSGKVSFERSKIGGSKLESKKEEKRESEGRGFSDEGEKEKNANRNGRELKKRKMGWGCN